MPGLRKSRNCCFASFGSTGPRLGSTRTPPAQLCKVCTTWRSAANAIRKKHATRQPVKCCACHALRSAKCCACREKCNPSSENDAKVLGLSHTTTFDTLWNMLGCHEVPRLPHATRGYATFETSWSDHLCSTPHRHCHSVLMRPHHEWLRTVAGTKAASNENSSTPRPPK